MAKKTGKKLGKIEKPEADQYKGKKMLYLVPLMITFKDAPKELSTKFSTYWQQSAEHIKKLESRMGQVRKIYHEAVTQSGEDGLKALKGLSPDSFKVASQKCKQGAQFEVIEDKELLLESNDWQRFLLLGFSSQKVASVVTEAYLKATRSRYEHIASKINETLKSGEAGILFIREGHMVQFPRDIEVISVSPPMLDEINRWLRDKAQVPLEETEGKKKEEKERGKKD